MLKVPAAVAMELMVNTVLLAPEASAAPEKVQVTSPPGVGPLWTQLQLVPLALSKLSPASRLSTTVTTPLVGRGPLLCTRMELAVGEPWATGLGVLDLEIERSAPSCATLPFSEPLLLALSGSDVTAAMVAVLVNGPEAGAVTLMAISSVAPTGRLARVQVTVLAAVPQVQAPPTTLSMVKPAGTVSLTVTVLAAKGPALRGRRVNVAGLLATTVLGDTTW